MDVCAMGFYDFQTNLRTTDAVEAFETFQKIKKCAADSGVPLNGYNVTSEEIISTIVKNQYLSDVLKFNGVTWASGSIGDYFTTTLKDIGYALLFLVMSPLSLISGIIAHFKFTDLEYDKKDIFRDRNTHEGMIIRDYVRDNYLQKPAVTNGFIGNVRVVSGDNDISSCYFDPLHNVVSISNYMLNARIRVLDDAARNSLPKKQIVNHKSSVRSMAIILHEFGHARQRIFLIVQIAVIAIVIVLFSILSFTIGIILVTAAIPLVTYVVERDASKRAIVNLIGADDIIGNGKDVATAVEILQYAATTYLFSACSTAVAIANSFATANKAANLRK
ncbi:MAG: zinc metallopeptidase [Puniceicoccales bacterium]|jgi:hypothetical protein|nr:zinc metallopeptidase [Puniceicoccales bacterium]